MHEHINGFGLINMNGRVYDPKLGRFLSPDPMLQDPSNSQNMNRYSYVWNNPLKYTDPSGYTSIAAVATGGSGVSFSNPRNIWGGHDGASYVGGSSSSFPKMGILSGEAGSTFEDLFVQGPTGNWVSRSALKSNIVSQNNSSRANAILNYMQDGFDINFVNNGTANYALAISGGVTKGSAAGITWNANFSDSGLHLGFNKGVNSFSKGGNALAPSTVGQNWRLFGGRSTYAGGNNPMTKSGKYTYSYVPTMLTDYPAIGHDRRYDNLGITGANGLFLTLELLEICN